MKSKVEELQEKACEYANSYYSDVYTMDDNHPQGWQDLFDSYMMGYRESQKSIEECFSLVLEFFKDEPHKAFWWFTTENPLLGGTTPARMIEMGRTEKLLTFIKGLLSENIKNGN